MVCQKIFKYIPFLIVELLGCSPYLNLLEIPKDSKRRTPMSYIPLFALKIFAGLIHAIFARIFPKYIKHGRMLMTIYQKMTLIALSYALGITYRDIPLLAIDLADVLCIKNITFLQNFNAFARRIRPQTLQTIIEAIAVIVSKFDDNDLCVILIDFTGLPDYGCPALLSVACTEIRRFLQAPCCCRSQDRRNTLRNT